MATKVASILAEIGLDSSKFTGGAKGVLSGLEQIISGLGSTAGVVGIVGGALAALVVEMQKAEQAAVESAKADAKLEAVLYATGNAVGKTSDQLNDLADQISTAIGVDDELVKSSEAVLMTFTQIGGDVFPATMLAAADMAAVMGGDLQGAIVQVGKAMNDFSGYTALKRAGVSFTEEQLKQIAHFKETNDLAGYQSLILSELGREFGGAAGKINQAGDGAENLKTAIGNLQEEIGRGFIPQARAMNKATTESVNSYIKATQGARDYNEAIADLGITDRGFFLIQQDGTIISREQADQLLENAQVAKIVDDTMRDLADSQEGLGKAVELTDEQLKEQEEQVKTLTEYNKGLLNVTASMQSANETYEKSASSLTKERIELEAERSLKLSQGYQSSGSVIKELDQKLLDNSNAAIENANQHTMATRTIILGMLEQRLATDGLDTRETEFLLKKGVEWGIYSDTAIAEMRAAMQEAEILSASINEIPTSKDITITTHYVSVGGKTGGHEDTGIGGYANGGDFIVPPGYPNDSYPMRVQSGERVTVTPAGQAAPQGFQFDYDRLARVMRDAVMVANG
jgi:Prophage tail length tape measure protein